MLKRMFLIIVCLATAAFGEFQYIDFDNVTNDNTLTLILRERLSRTGDTFTFSNAATIDNATNGAITFTEASEDLIWTFTSDKVALSSSTSLAEIDFASIFIEMAEISAPGNPGSDTGRIYVRDVGTVTTLFFLDSSGVETSLIAAAAGNSLDGAYNAGNTIDVDGNPVTLTVSDTDNNRVLDIVQNDITNDPEAMRLTNTGSGDTLQFVSTGGNDIDGSGSTWQVTSAGALTVVSGVIPTLTVNTTFTVGATIDMTNGGKISNATNNEIEFEENSEELSMAFTSNTITWATDTAIDAMAFGVVDDLTGIGTIAFDAAASTITLAAGGAGQDLTIQVTGAENATLALASSGTAADAMTFITTAGGIDITNGGAAGGEDIDISSTLASVNITGGEAVADAVVINASNAAGGIDIIAGADIDITTTGTAGEDISITNTGGSLFLTANEDIADVIVIATTGGGGGSESISINNDQGTEASAATESDASIQLDSTVGGIGLRSALNGVNAIRLETDGGGNEQIILHSNQGTSVTEGTASIQLLSDVGGIVLESNSNLVNAITLVVDGGTTETITIHADLGNSVSETAASIQLVSDAGGISLLSQSNLAKAIQLVADGGTTETIFIQADQGDTATSIHLVSDDGGVTIDAAKLVTTGGGTVKSGIQDIVAGLTSTAADLTKTVITVGADGGGDIVTIANGTAGQILYLIDEDATGTLTITPATFNNSNTSITFDALGDSVTLIYTTGTGWTIVGQNSITLI